MKKLLCILLVLCMLFSLSGCAGDFLIKPMFFLLIGMGDNRADKNEVFEFVRENEEELLKAIEDGDFSAFENKGFIGDVDADSDRNLVDFSCGGVGIGSGTSYVGFYYSPDDDMTSIWCAPYSGEPLIPHENGFEWREENGDNRYYTEHICGHFYYYEASF